MSGFYKVGKIVNTHGVRGEVRVITTSDFVDERYAVGNELFYFNEENQLVTSFIVKSHRRHKNFDLLTFENYHNINEVEKYKGGYLKIKERDLQELEEDEFYYHEIIGCQVITDTGEVIGTIKEILSPGANDVWVVKPIEGKKDILIPYIDDVVLDVSVEEKKITIHIIEGLLE